MNDNIETGSVTTAPTTEQDQNLTQTPDPTANAVPNTEEKPNLDLGNAEEEAARAEGEDDNEKKDKDLDISVVIRKLTSSGQGEDQAHFKGGIQFGTAKVIKKTTYMYYRQNVEGASGEILRLDGKEIDSKTEKKAVNEEFRAELELSKKVGMDANRQALEKDRKALETSVTALAKDAEAKGLELYFTRDRVPAFRSKGKAHATNAS